MTPARWFLLALCALALGGCWAAPDDHPFNNREMGMAIGVVFITIGLIFVMPQPLRCVVAFISGLIFLLVACSPAQAAPLRESALPLLDRAHIELCEIESRTSRNRDTAISPEGAVGRCQVKPDTAAWMVKPAMIYGYLDPSLGSILSRYTDTEAWTWFLTWRIINEAISKAYLRWILEHRTRDLRTAFYLYHCGQDCPLPMVRDTESWDHAANVYRALYPLAPPRAAVKHHTMVVKR